jgi:hypothetical protein
MAIGTTDARASGCAASPDKRALQRDGPCDRDRTVDICRWKRIVLGTHASANLLCEALHRVHCAIGYLAREALYQPGFTLSPSETVLDVAILSVGHLGFGQAGAPVSEIHTRAGRLGLRLCPAEAAPQLRLQYLDQPVREFLHVAMDPVATRCCPVGLSVVNGGTRLTLIGSEVRPAVVFPSAARFVFAHPR